MRDRCPARRSKACCTRARCKMRSRRLNSAGRAPSMRLHAGVVRALIVGFGQRQDPSPEQSLFHGELLELSHIATQKRVPAGFQAGRQIRQ